MPHADKPCLLCFSHLRWDFVFQRPQHLLSRAAQDYEVMFFEEPVYEPRSDSHLSINRTAEGAVVLIPRLPQSLSPDQAIAAQRQLLMTHLQSANLTPEVGWYYTPMALPFSGHLRFSLCVYDCMDELSAFKAAPIGLPQLEKRLFSKADVVFTGGYSLYDAKRNQHPNIHAFPSSVDAAHFKPARSSRARVPADLASIAGPRIGYFGVVDERLDLSLISDLAERRPDWAIVMIGPVVKVDPASLPQRPNIHWLGGKQYADLPSYLSGLDVGWMPFAINAATRYISPTKTPEFLAAGLPVVSTRILDVARSWGDIVAIADNAEAAERCIHHSLGKARTAAFCSTVDERLDVLSWDNTWERMHQLMTLARDKRAGKLDISRVRAAATGPLTEIKSHV